MFIAPVKRRRGGGGFTLLEIMLAVVILGMMSLAIYRFVATNLTALKFSAEANAEDAQYSGFERLLSSQWQSLPPGVGALLGEPLKLDERSRDEVTWICGTGPGLMTRYGEGEYRVTLRVRPMAKKGDAMELGVTRESANHPPGGESDENWVPLLENVQSLKVNYFDPRLNAWVDKWTDTVTLPRLVKVAIGRSQNPIPWEAIIALGRTPL